MQITTTTVTATSRQLDPKWRLVWNRVPTPKNVDVNEFPHKVDVWNMNMIQHEQALNWCSMHVGVLDEAWTYTDSEHMMFKHVHDALHFTLSMQ